MNIFLLDELEGLTLIILTFNSETLIKRFKIALVVNGNRDVEWDIYTVF